MAEEAHTSTRGVPVGLRAIAPKILPTPKGEAMLRVAFLVLYFTHLFISGSIHTKSGGGLDPLGLFASPLPSTDVGGGTDPNGAK